MTRRSSIWLFDLGNTRLKWACLDGDAMGDVHALPHAESGCSDKRFEHALAKIEAGATAWLASVASQALTTEVTAAIERRGVRVCHVHTQAGFAGVQIRFDKDNEQVVMRVHAVEVTRDVAEAGLEHGLHIPVRDFGRARSCRCGNALDR